jgi:thioesterase domain-containing protein
MTKHFTRSQHEIASRALQDFFMLNVPLARAAEISVHSYDGEKLVFQAPLEPNINDKGTAFGGSIYVLCVSTAWGMSSIKAQELGLDGELVVAKAEIEYLRPLNEDLHAEAVSPDEESLQHFKESFERHGKAVFELDVVANNSEGKACACFRGKYALLKRK